MLKQKLLEEALERKKRAEELKELPGGGKVNDAYAFTGMHHIWDHHKEQITKIEFANHDKSLLAFSSMDGDVTVCEAFPDPVVKFKLQGHSQGVIDFSWSSTNDLLLTASLDGTMKIWNISVDGDCIRTFEDGDVLTSCCFHPLNNNIFFVGNQKSKIKVMNMSTGQCLHKVGVSGAVNSLCFDPTGATLFIGDSKGYLYCYSFNSSNSRLQKKSKINVCSGFYNNSKAITTIAYKGWSNSSDNTPELLIGTQDKLLKLYNVLNGDSIELKREFPFSCSSLKIGSCFCPLISLRDGACVVCGGEDMNICIYDVLRQQSTPPVNSLMGHSDSVTDVCFNYNESLLGSGDKSGTVILWKRIVIKKD
eukprot:TRINITY_DN11003_c0_g1_i2.p1 TRINITY_DN11003_c0_g1~~TRINITY_DN11003_c0_g1_i2.p1  ORF type:complete len:401 (-),score=119.35 TRINITY_DN11003_c0_g1_i2:77-1168(-)